MQVRDVLPAFADSLRQWWQAFNFVCVKKAIAAKLVAVLCKKKNLRVHQHCVFLSILYFSLGCVLVCMAPYVK